jgi:hypothetical protein
METACAFCGSSLSVDNVLYLGNKDEKRNVKYFCTTKKAKGVLESECLKKYQIEKFERKEAGKKKETSSNCLSGDFGGGGTC